MRIPPVPNGFKVHLVHVITLFTFVWEVRAGKESYLTTSHILK
jgi:hypothetical protein